MAGSIPGGRAETLSIDLIAIDAIVCGFATPGLPGSNVSSAQVQLSHQLMDWIFVSA